MLTKIDKIDAASDKESLVKVLKNETKPLPKYGYFGVINRSLNIHDSDHLHNDVVDLKTLLTEAEMLEMESQEPGRERL